MSLITPFTIGEYDAEAAQRFRQFHMVFHTTNLRLAWSHSDLCANFLAHYFAHAFPPGGADLKGWLSREEITHSINYLTNELMENAIKFHCGETVTLTAGLYETVAGFLVSNEISDVDVSAFSKVLQEIVAEDPGLLLLQKIEENAEKDEGTGSGLGFLTLMSDYQIMLGWRFAPSPLPGKVQVTTMARLNLRENANV